MRAHEFVSTVLSEVADAKISKRKQYSTRGLHTFHDGDKWNSDYTLNRVMMAVACTDGTFVPEIDSGSFFGKSKTAQPYTKEEQNMLKMAYKAVGATWKDLNHGDMDSEEVPGGNITSPMTSFKGYPR